jgi:response regulator RpfG family c-di-GMP phosphodiesterase
LAAHAVAPPPPERDTIATSEALPEVLRVLIVDDSTMNRKFVKRNLQQLPHTEAWEMVDAETAERAIELASGEYIAVFHGDDVYSPEIIAKEVCYLEKNADNYLKFFKEFYQ